MCIQFFRPSATGRIEFSARLLLSSSSGYPRYWKMIEPLRYEQHLLSRWNKRVPG